MKTIILFLFLSLNIFAQNSLIILMSSDPTVASIDTIPSQFTFTDVTDAALSSYNQAYIVVAGCDSARFYTNGTDSLKLGVLGTYDVGEIWADVGDSVYVPNVASASNSTATHSIIYSSNGTPLDTFTVTTVAGATHPSNLDSATTLVWVEFADSVVTAWNGEVAIWGDKSISNNDLVPPDTVNRPEVNANGIKIHPDNQGLIGKAFTLTQPTTIYFVFRMDSTGTPYIYDGNSNETMLFYTQNGTEYKIYGGAASTTDTLSIGLWYVVTAVFNGTGGVFQINDRTAITGNVGTASPNGFKLGGTGSGVYGKFTVKAVIVRNLADSETTRTNIKDYLNDKYSIY